MADETKYKKKLFRPETKKAIKNLALFSVVFLVFTLFMFFDFSGIVNLFKSHSDIDLYQATYENMAIAGGEVLENIGWVFGVYLATLLGFYAVVVAQQVKMLPNMVQKQKGLGETAIVLTATLAPMLLLILVTCFEDGHRWGVFFAVGPVAVLTWFLAIRLGSFTFDEEGTTN